MLRLIQSNRSAASTVCVLLAFWLAPILQAQSASAAHATSSSAVAVTAEAAYDRVAKAWSVLKTLHADFEQSITNPLLGRTAKSKGVFLQERPAKVSIAFTEPAGDRIVGDGKWLWVYLPSSAPGQVLRLPANSDGAVVADLLSQLLDSPKRSFTITGGEEVAVGERTTTRVELIPRTSGSVPFKKATLWLDRKEPRPLRVQVTDVQGVERTIELKTWMPNTTLPSDAFRFSAPKGVRINTNPPGN